jgi:hypothetical protein
MIATPAPPLQHVLLKYVVAIHKSILTNIYIQGVSVNKVDSSYSYRTLHLANFIF